MTLESLSALVFAAVLILGAYALIPFLLFALMLILLIPGFIVSMFTREKWK